MNHLGSKIDVDLGGAAFRGRTADPSDHKHGSNLAKIGLGRGSDGGGRCV